MSKPVRDFFKFCGLLRKPQLYEECFVAVLTKVQSGTLDWIPNLKSKS